jgi:hypothetical protein
MGSEGKYEGLKGKRGRETTSQCQGDYRSSRAISECSQIFVRCQEGDGNLMKSSLTEPDSGAEKELGSN